jgi:hypothetical protein
MPWVLILGSHQKKLMLGSKKITMDEKFTWNPKWLKWLIVGWKI